jgi:hypothetical protein
MRKPTKEEIDERVLKSGVDARTDDVYINAITPMEFYCSKGHRWKTKLGNVTHNHQGCPYCSGQLPIIGETDLWTTHPEIARLLLDYKKGYELTKGSGRKEEFICPVCGAISKHIISNVVRRGFSCPMCSDGVSYPNKFAANMFTQINVQFTHEFSFDDANYRYDFYLPDYNVIVEMHGRQHYEEWNRTSRTLKEEQTNDSNKMEFAIKHGIQNYIVVDARYSDINYISNNILKSQLKDILNLSGVNWRECGYYAGGSLVCESAKLYNDGYSVSDISEKIKHSIVTVRKFLKKGTEIGLCNWEKSSGFLKEKQPVVLVNTKECFDSISEAGRRYNTSFQNISANCNGSRKYAGFNPVTGEPLVWRYKQDYDPKECIDFKVLINPRAYHTMTAQN